jgi:ComF family protein
MIDRLLETIAPHHCYGCHKLGTLLCGNCKYDIVLDKFFNCVACGSGISPTGVCASCRVPYSRAWCVGERSGTLQQLIGGHKFRYVRGAYRPLAQLLLEALDQLPPGTVVVPIPTIAAHIRERGFDHTLLLARYVAKKRGLKVEKVLRRVTNTKQRDAGRAKRIAQAKTAFRLQGKVQKSTPYLLIDDVVTTGATLQYAAEVLKTAGVEEVWVAVIARQPLD